MTESLPAHDSWVPSHKEAVIKAVSGVTPRALPRIPDRVKRLLLGGRTVTVDGNTLDTTLQLMLAGLKMVGFDGLSGPGEVAASRAQLRDLSAGLARNIPVAGVTNLSVDGAAGPIPARHYRSADSRAPLLVFFHGGGFVIGDLDTHDCAVPRSSAVTATCTCCSVDYRLAPEHKAPAASDDGLRRLPVGTRPRGRTRAPTPTVWRSAATAPAATSRRWWRSARATSRCAAPALQLLIYPCTNLTAADAVAGLVRQTATSSPRPTSDWFSRPVTSTARRSTATDPRVSPLLADDLSGLSPALVLITAGFDPLRDEGRAVRRGAARRGRTRSTCGEFGSLIHGFANFFPLGGGSATATAEMISALRAHLTRG